MSLRLSVAPLALLVSFFFFSPSAGSALADIVVANCTSLSWTFNSHGQSPCTVAAFMLSTCFAPGILSLPPLPPGGAYSVPKYNNSNYCECSTVGYSLVSACVACQQQVPLNWSQYSTNCTSVLPPSQFPNPVPSGVFVPHWAILDFTSENGWNATKSIAVGDSPEYGPGAIIDASSVTTSTSASAAPSGSGPPTAPPNPSHSKSSLGQIACGIAGGVGVTLIGVAAFFFYRRWKRKRKQAGPGPVLMDTRTETGWEDGRTEPFSVPRWAEGVAASNLRQSNYNPRINLGHR